MGSISLENTFVFSFVYLTGSGSSACQENVRTMQQMYR